VTQASETEHGAAPTPAAGGRGAKRPGNPISRIPTFNRQVVAELRKVIWPSRKQLVTYTLVVLVFVSFMVALVALLDFLVGQGVNALFGA
jgi:preprotein translocase subunit SecE